MFALRRLNDHAVQCKCSLAYLQPFCSPFFVIKIPNKCLKFLSVSIQVITFVFHVQIGLHALSIMRPLLRTVMHLTSFAMFADTSHPTRANTYTSKYFHDNLVNKAKQGRKVKLQVVTYEIQLTAIFVKIPQTTRIRVTIVTKTSIKNSTLTMKSCSS